MLWDKQQVRQKAAKGRTGAGLGVLFGEVSSPTALAGLSPPPCPTSSTLTGDTPVWGSSLRLHSGSEVGVLTRWKDPHLLCSPLGLINGVVLEWLISFQCLTEPAMHHRALQLQFFKRLGKNSFAFPCSPQEHLQSPWTY